MRSAPRPTPTTRVPGRRWRYRSGVNVRTPTPAGQHPTGRRCGRAPPEVYPGSKPKGTPEDLVVPRLTDMHRWRTLVERQFPTANVEEHVWMPVWRRAAAAQNDGLDVDTAPRHLASHPVDGPMEEYRLVDQAVTAALQQQHTSAHLGHARRFRHGTCGTRSPLHLQPPDRRAVGRGPDRVALCRAPRTGEDVRARSGGESAPCCTRRSTSAPARCPAGVTVSPQVSAPRREQATPGTRASGRPLSYDHKQVRVAEWQTR